MRKKLPRMGSVVRTPDGDAEVVGTNGLTEKVKVKAELPDGTYEMRVYKMSEVRPKGKRAAAAAVEEAEVEIDEEMKALLDE
jgi:hypothetical protein